jgi:hypothetical protein
VQPDSSLAAASVFEWKLAKKSSGHAAASETSSPVKHGFASPARKGLDIALRAAQDVLEKGSNTKCGSARAASCGGA